MLRGDPVVLLIRRKVEDGFDLQANEALMVIGRGIDEVADDLVVGSGSRRRRRRWRQGGQPGIGRLNEGFELVSNHHKLDVPNGDATGAAAMYSFSAATGICQDRKST